MPPSLRKFALGAHVTSSVGLLGAVACFLALAVTGLTSRNAQIVRAAYLAMDLTAWLVIVPLAFASVLTGLVQSLGTTWGLFRHYWVLVKLLLTVLVTFVLLLKMELIGHVAGIAAQVTLSDADLRAARMELVVHAGGGLLVLLAPVALSLYKPWGMTRYGKRKQYERRMLSQPGSAYAEPDREPRIRTARWAYVVGTAVLVLIMLFVILMHIGAGHGPVARHCSDRCAGVLRSRSRESPFRLSGCYGKRPRASLCAAWRTRIDRRPGILRSDVDLT
ncbi:MULTISPECIES: hypothetical protein [unclassified Variovorax]|nr:MULTISPECIES: hypothetical protein [unclassified Variovorax]